MELSPFPRFFSPERAAVPFAVMTDIVATTCDLRGFEVSNSTAATITLTIQDKQSSAKKLFDAINIDPNMPVVIEIAGAEGRCLNGVAWQASATGLTGRAWGLRHTGWTMNANNQVVTAL